MPRTSKIHRRCHVGVWRAAGLLCAVTATAAVVSGCETYQPRPLDSTGHRTAWHGRTLENAALAPFLERSDDGAGAQPGPFDPSDGLALSEGRLFALAYNPQLRLARLRLDRAGAVAEHAGLPADPVLSLGLLRVARDVPNQWIVSPALSFSIPLSTRLEVEREHAGAEQVAAAQRVVEREWAVLHDVRTAWSEWSAARLRLDETRRLFDTLAALVTTAASLTELGEVPRVEAALFELERARSENHVQRLAAETAAAEHRIRALLGLSPDAPLVLVPSLATDSPWPHAGPAEIAAQNPSLARLRAEYDVAEEQVRREIVKQYPDLDIGPEYESDEGQSSFGVRGGIPLPVFNANARGIAAARADREIARAAYETEYERLVGRWAVARTRLAGLSAQRADLEMNLVPLVDRQLLDAANLVELGETSMLVLLESVAQAHETKLDHIDTRLLEALTQAEIDHLVGPPRATRAAAEEERR